MIHFKKTKVAIHYSSAHDKSGMDLIKETNQFPNYYHKGKKGLVEGECDMIFFVPAKSTGLGFAYLGTIHKVTKIDNYNGVDPRWLVDIEQKEKDWDMLVTMDKVVKVPLTYMESLGYPTDGIQGGIRYMEV